jgi:predicted lipoprotein with Yx(FWY)xxD motif
MAAAVAAFAGTALIAAACGGGTSSKDKTATAAAKGGATPAAAATKPAAVSTTASGTTPAASTSPAAAGGAVTLKVGTDATLGKFLTDDKGLTLYTFKNDTAGSGKSACNGGCATAWPALMGSAPTTKPAGVTGDFAIITRDDGTKQVSYKGMPLYYFASDKAAGDTKGQGLNNVWFVAAP